MGKQKVGDVVINDWGISIEIFGQKFKEFVFNEDGYPPKEWMIGFGQKMKYLGEMIERQAKYGLPVKASTGSVEHIAIGFDKDGKLIKP